ncbi:gluconokinase [Enemella evansiae]|uniref:gluconokinase n=1 Tax=Enemella evansiae TaxID=2016499 RepID=UPI0010DF3CFD|nr:gluconokinase [Enemella evansiae]TDO91490.1 gluconate kinase (SKI family) [Enemella evansiae]
MTAPDSAPLAVVMGVSGCGKSTIGALLAERLAVPFADADAFHPAANIAKMSAGIPLDDADRRPWLASIGEWLAEHRARGAVMACSALKRTYRDQIRTPAPGTVFLHLDGPFEVALTRVQSRPGHFMPASLLRSQYADLQPLESDEAGTTADFARPADALVGEFAAWLDHTR